MFNSGYTFINVVSKSNAHEHMQAKENKASKKTKREKKRI